MIQHQHLPLALHQKKRPQAWWVGLLVTVLMTAMQLCTPELLLSQGGSNYTHLGLGDLRPQFGAGYDGLGGTAYGVTSPYLINTLNPAAWSYSQSTRIQIGYRFNQQRITDDNNGLTSQNNGKLDGGALLFSIDTAMGIGASVGISPSTSVNYFSQREFRAPQRGASDVTGKMTYLGSGGLVTAHFGGSVKLHSTLSFGIMGLVNFGTITSSAQQTITGGVDSSNTAITRVVDEMSGFGMRVGLLYEPMPGLTFGASLMRQGKLAYDANLRYITASSNGAAVVLDTIFTSTASTAMPQCLGLGFSYTTGKFLFAGDAEFTSTTGMTDYRMLSNTSYAPSAQRYSFGISRMGVNAPGTPYWDRVSINVGGGWRGLYYIVNSQQITETYASFGLQLPFGGAAMVDAAITAGIRGATTNGLVREEFIRLTAAVSVGDIWFVPFRRQE